MRTVTLRTPILVGLFSVLFLWGYIVHRKGLLLAFYPLVFVVTKEVCGCAFRWAIDVDNRRVQHPGHTNGGDDKIGRTNPGML